MSLSVIQTRAQLGVESPAVQVEVHLSGGLPSLSIVGLPETAVKESRERVRSALITAGFDFPQRRITINLAPADLPKEGGRYDLAIALGILAASGQIKREGFSDLEVVGELALSGEVRSVRGVLPAAIACGQQQRTLIVPAANADEAAMSEGTVVIPVSHLLGLCAHLQGETRISPHQRPPLDDGGKPLADLGDVRGQLQARRALEVAAAGMHNLLFLGPPGSGKSMLASRLPGLLPPMAADESLEVASIHSVAGLPVEAACLGRRPFRSPHHTASAVALVGGGGRPRPGEISLSHQGVLFLDELPEFPRRVLEVLREPMETGEILISRAAHSTRYPARFLLAAAMNPCPCGYFGDGTERCHCSPDQVRRYQQRISGPLLDRIDLQLAVPALPPDELLEPGVPGESSDQVRQRVLVARERQLQRQGCVNRDLDNRQLMIHCALSEAGRRLLSRVMEKHSLSARACHRLLRVARTLADLQGIESIDEACLLEAVIFRGQSNQS
jgi:magnesium chelatase family protein